MDHIFNPHLLPSPRTNVKTTWCPLWHRFQSHYGQIMFIAWPPLVKSLTVPFETNFKHVYRFFDLCYLYRINILIRSFIFLHCLVLASTHSSIKLLGILRSCFALLTAIFNIDTLCMCNWTAHFRWVIGGFSVLVESSLMKKKKKEKCTTAGTFISKIFELDSHISYRKTVLRSTEKAFFFGNYTS